MKVPVIIASSLICLALGIGAGAAGMTFFGYTWPVRSSNEESASDNIPKGEAPPGMGKGGMPGMGKGGMPGMGKGGGKGPSAKAQLATLVAKLDVLTHKPLTVTLDTDRKKRVAAQLKDLDAMEKLDEEDAKKRLDTLLEVLKNDQEPLEAVGFRFPGQKAGGGAPMGMMGVEPPNPFKIDPNSTRLQSLQERLAK